MEDSSCLKREANALILNPVPNPPYSSKHQFLKRRLGYAPNAIMSFQIMAHVIARQKYDHVPNHNHRRRRIRHHARRHSFQDQKGSYRCPKTHCDAFLAGIHRLRAASDCQRIQPQGARHGVSCRRIHHSPHQERRRTTRQSWPHSRYHRLRERGNHKEGQYAVKSAAASVGQSVGVWKDWEVKAYSEWCLIGSCSILNSLRTITAMPPASARSSLRLFLSCSSSSHNATNRSASSLVI